MPDLAPRVVRILHLDDNSYDAQLVEMALAMEKERFPTSLTYVQSKEEYLEALERKDFDVILSDYRMPVFDGEQALKAARQKRPDIPFIMVTGELGEERAIETLQRGATDYVIKDRIFRLVPAIRRALTEAENARKRNEAELALQRTQANLQDVLESVQDGFYSLDRDWKFTYVNKHTLSLWKKKSGELLGHSLLEAFPGTRKLHAFARMHRAMIERTPEVFDNYSAFLQHWHHVRIYPTHEGIAVYFTDITNRKQTEEALRQSEELARSRLRELEAIYRTAPVGLCILDKELRWVRINDRLAELNGVPVEAHIGKTPRELLPDVGAQAEAAMRKIMETGEPLLDFEIKGMTPARPGEVRTWSERWLPLKDEKGNVIGISVAAEETTELKRLHQELEQSRAQLMAVFESMSDGVIVFDMGGNAILVNDAEARINGYPTAEAMKQDLAYFASVYELYHLNGRLLPVEEWPVSRVLRGESLPRCELRGKRKDTGQEWIFSFTGEPVRDESGKQILAVLITRDITERKLAEDNLRRSQMMLAEAQRLSNIGAWEWDIVADRWTFSDEWRAIHGVGTKTLTSEELIAIAHPDDRAAIQQAFENARTGRHAYQMEHRINRQDTREERFVRASGRFVRNDAGAVVRLYGFVQDITEQKKTEEVLRRKEAELLEAQRLAHVGSWFWDATTDRVTVSDEIFAIYGLDPSRPYPPLKEQDGTILPHDTWNQVNEAIQKAVATGEGYELDLEINHGKGGTIWVTARGEAVRDASGRVIGLRGTVHDITERKRAEENLKASQERFAKAFLASPDALVISRVEDGTIVEVNDAFLELFGWTRDEVLGQSSIFLNMFADPEERQAAIGALRRDGKLRNFETLVKRRSGEERTVVLSSESLELAGKPIFLTVLHDVTEQKNREEQLRQSTALLRTIMESTSDLIFVKDREGRMIMANPAVLRSHRKTQDQILGKTTIEYLNKTEGRKILENDLRIMETNTEETLEETAFSHETGTPRVYLAKKSPFRDSRGRVIGLVGVARDITEHKQAEREIRRLNEELEQRVRDRTEQLEAANRELESFAYSVSHDLKAPLRAISGFTGLLMRGPDRQLGEREREALELISTNAAYMGHLISALLEFSRLSQKALRTTTVDIGVLAQEAVEQQRHVHAHMADRVRVILHQLPPVQGDPLLLRQVVVNLVSNAFKYTQKEEHPRIEIGAMSSGQYHTFFVRDNGVGFPSHQASKLFQVFQRLHGQAEFEGTGIGLANVRKIVERHGGKVWAEGAEGEGAAFYFTLPAA